MFKKLSNFIAHRTDDEKSPIISDLQDSSGYTIGAPNMCCALKKTYGITGTLVARDENICSPGPTHLVFPTGSALPLPSQPGK